MSKPAASLEAILAETPDRPSSDEEPAAEPVAPDLISAEPPAVHTPHDRLSPHSQVGTVEGGTDSKESSKPRERKRELISWEKSKGQVAKVKEVEGRGQDGAWDDGPRYSTERRCAFDN